ncbi:DDB1- and CUL4-associated factor 4-like [Anneissia japonica]|uniref:DDB1- and CUL4-associated factor 4-like n=1 Tax=Anneissia japonica TaxID=1529436 RepID=UPI0014255FA7|nr:DDB1- and CUL4-associated factor 4-like [Anneissia japonica]
MLKMPRQQWWTWRNKKSEDNQTRKVDVNPRRNNDPSINERRKRRQHWSDGKSRQTSNHDGGMRSASESGKLHQHEHNPQNYGTSRHDKSSSGGTSTSSFGRDIPGFYFDPVKKRYFRLLPGHNNHNPISNEMLQEKEAEKKRLDLLNSDSAINQGATNNLESKSICPSISQILLQRQRGKISSCSYVRQCHEACVARMPVKSSNQISSCPDTGHHFESGYITLLQADKSKKKILTVISNDRFSSFWQGTVTANKENSSQFDIKNWKNISCVGRCGKVTSASWVSVDDQHDTHVLYSVSGGQESQVQLFAQYPDARHILYVGWEKGIIWTCSWSENKVLANHLSFGGRRSYIVDIVTSLKTKLNTNGSDVLCQVFAKSQPLLYNGTKRGEILSCDLRTPSRRNFASILHHHTSVCCLQLLNDENYIIASDMSGKVNVYKRQIRMCAVAREYHGNNNQHRHLPFNIDSTESVLYTVGQDCFTRIWSIHTGNLLKTLPPPLSASKQTLPSVVYSTNWTGTAGPGLLLGTQKQFHWYTL